MDARCCIQHAIYPLSDQERGACDAALHLSQHTKIELLPNVHINERLELSGFHFEAAGCDLANVLPMPTNLFNCIVAYEVLNEKSSNFNDTVLHILQNLQEYKDKLAAVMDELSKNTANVPSFACMVEEDDEALIDDQLVFAKNSCDRQVWDEQKLNKVGIYHAFVRPHTKDSIEHKIFICCSGSVPFLDEEWHRLWQDTSAYTSCQQLLESEEINWFRSATLRHHNRVAARVADALGLPIRCFIDTEDPSNKKRSAHPTTVTMRNDIHYDLHTRRVHMVHDGCFLHNSANGILHEMHASEGFWLFQGPVDTASYNCFGTIFHHHKDVSCFPTTTLRYNDQFQPRGTIVSSQHGGESTKDTIWEVKTPIQVDTLFPDETYMKKAESLGYSRNSQIISLMPIIQYVSAKSI
jgi:hypothetical protein